MKLYIKYIFIIFVLCGNVLRVRSGESVEALLAAVNLEGFPLALLAEAAGAGEGAGEGEGDLEALLERPGTRAAAQAAALRVAAQRLLEAPASARALLAFDWADRRLCAYPWLSWLPWLACRGEGTQYSEDAAAGRVYADEALPPGECYSDVDGSP